MCHNFFFFFFTLLAKSLHLKVELTVKFRILAGKGNAGSRNSEHSPRPCYETGLLPLFSMLMDISVVKQERDVLISVGCVLSMQVLVDFQENPKAAQEHTKNPMVMSKIQKLVSAGIVQMR